MFRGGVHIRIFTNITAVFAVKNPGLVSGGLVPAVTTNGGIAHGGGVERVRNAIKAHPNCSGRRWKYKKTYKSATRTASNINCAGKRGSFRLMLEDTLVC